MKKNIIFMVLICAVVLSLCGSVAAVDNMNTTNLTSNKHVFINVSNDKGVKYNLDYPMYVDKPGAANSTYYILADGGGKNALHVTNKVNVTNGQVTVINTASTSSSGVLYLTDTGGRGYNDNIILLLSVKGPIPDNFAVHITSSGYTWTATGSTPAGYTYVPGAVNETFTRADFQYGPQIYKPGPGTLGVWDLPLYYGQTTSDPSTAEYLMFIDLYLGTLKGSAFPDLINNGSIMVEYNFTNLNTTASFNIYGWCLGANQAQGINWINPTTGTSASGYTVNYSPVTPVADFTADSTAGSDSLTVKFTDKSTNYPTSWTWNFGDGTTSNDENPTHTYAKPGKYTVTLTAANAAGFNELTKTDYITVLDTIKPAVTSDHPGGNYSTAPSVTLTTTDASSTTTYYTTDGSDPITSSTRKEYTGAVQINSTTTLKFAAVDAAGNWSPVYTENYNIKSNVYVNVTPSKTNPQVGDKVTYTFKLGNNGPGVAKDVLFTYVIPEGLEFAGANVDQGTWSYNEITRTLTWNLGDVAVGDPKLWLDLKILSSGKFNIQPLVSVSGYDPELQNSISSLLVNAVSASTNNGTNTGNSTASGNDTNSGKGTTTVKAASQTTTNIPMQDTGVPLAGLAVALLLVGSGLTLGRKK
ncbi:PKD domain-containing protein [Methanobacterium sp.]|uniref:PKD domain-containing protein n=1 Tax=Methanobacterium sp. TaxID=2164 RepID=UPI003C793EA2